MARGTAVLEAMPLRRPDPPGRGRPARILGTNGSWRLSECFRRLGRSVAPPFPAGSSGVPSGNNWGGPQLVQELRSKTLGGVWKQKRVDDVTTVGDLAGCCGALQVSPERELPTEHEPGPLLSPFVVSRISGVICTLQPTSKE